MNGFVAFYIRRRWRHCFLCL